MTRFSKSYGITASEKYLAEQCERSFLSLWSFPNVFREPGKELCDVLIVFREHIIIFSDKSCSFPNTGNVELDWSRWFKRAVERSAQQVFGAERWLKRYPERIFLDPACREPFPLPLPDSSRARIHRVVVALNASERCKQHFNNSGSGSLLIRPDIIGNRHQSVPFTVGQIDPEKGYVHVFDDVSLTLVLNELDTITDFTDYLVSKETFIKSGRLAGSAGEEELLAHYVTTLNSAGEHGFAFDQNTDAVWFLEGSWEGISGDPRYAAKKKADQNSYAWDALIETFNRNLRAGTLAADNDVPLENHERGLRMMAGEPRLSRRTLMAALFDLLTTAPKNKTATRLVLSKQYPERAFQFIVDPKPDHLSYEQYRERRSALLAAYCHVAKLRAPQLRHIIGIATEPLGARGRSEDLVYLNAEKWTEENEAEARQLQEATGILVNPRERPFHDDEYPEVMPMRQPQAGPGNRKQRRAAVARKRKIEKS